MIDWEDSPEFQILSAEVDRLQAMGEEHENAAVEENATLRARVQELERFGRDVLAQYFGDMGPCGDIPDHAEEVYLCMDKDCTYCKFYEDSGKVFGWPPAESLRREEG